MASFFISYSHKNMIQADNLEAVLNAHGIPTWRDRSNLDIGLPMEERIKRAILDPKEVQGYILIATPESWRSKPVQEWEIHSALQRHADDPSFPLIVMFQDITIDQIKFESKKRHGIDLTDSLGASLPASYLDEDLVPHFNELAGKIVARMVADHKRFNRITENGVELHIHGKQRTLFDGAPHFEIDLSGSLFKDGRMPNEYEWRNFIMRGLHDLKNALAEQLGTKIRIHVHAKASLSLGFALGYTFRESSGFNLDIDQLGESWSTVGDLGGVENLSDRIFRSDGSDIIFELPITHKTQDAVVRYMGAQGIDFRARRVLGFREPARNSVMTDAHARTIAQRTMETIRGTVSEYGGNRVLHLFYAGPFALAAMIGHQLNACGRIQLYDMTQDLIYTPTVTLI